MSRKIFGKTFTRVFKNLLPKTYENKSEGYHKFGWNDNLPLEIIEAINNSGVAKKAAKKYAQYIEADGFAHENAAKFKVNKDETADSILSKIGVSFSYLFSCAYHVSRKLDGSVHEAKVMPMQKLRKKLNGNWCYNETIGTEKFDKSKWVDLQNFQGTIAPLSALEINKNEFGGRGEIYYIFDGNPFDSDIYAIPDFVASIEDLKTSSEISKMDYEAVLNGFVLGGVMTFVGDFESQQKGEDGLTQRERIEASMEQFTGLRKNNDGLTSRFAVLTNFVSTPEQAPVYTGNDPKPILEASNTKRDIIDRAVCKLWGIHPVLLGFTEASVLGNDKAIAQASMMLKQSVNPIQRLITQSFENMFGTQIDWTISEVKDNYIEPALLADMTPEERRNLLSLPPVEQNIPSDGERLLKTLNGLSPLLATKVIDMIPQDLLLNALGIKAEIQTPGNEQ
jgi:hypothetical protein